MRWSEVILSRRWLMLPPILLGAGIVATLAASKKELNRVEVTESALPVEFITVSRGPMHPEIVAYGSAEPNRRWMAVAEVGGRVDATLANLESGVLVREGELLVSIDRADYELRLGQREADLRQAKSQLVQLKLAKKADMESRSIQQDLLGVREKELNRLEALKQRSAASQGQLDSARAAMLQQKQAVQTLVNALSTYDAQIESAEAAIMSSDARVKEAQRDVDRTRIHSPFNGILFRVDLEQGQYVARGQALFEVIDTSWVEVEAQVSTAQWSRVLQLMEEFRPSPAADSIGEGAMSAGETAVGSISATAGSPSAQSEAAPSLLGLTAVVTVRNGEREQEFIGAPIRLTSTLDEQTRTMGVVIRVDNPVVSSGVVDRTRRHLRPGAYCEVSMRSKSSVPAFRVPRSSIEDGTVLCIGKDDRLSRRQVNIAFSSDDHVAVTDGLSEADRVVVNPPPQALDGQLAEPIPSAAFGKPSAAKVAAHD